MTKYEIMLISPLSTPEENIEKFLKELFVNGVKTFEKMERTKFAYPINKITQGTYFLATIEAEPDSIAEFTRRSKLNKEIIRQIIINLDSEVGLNRIIKPRPKRVYKKPEGKYEQRGYGNKPRTSYHDRKKEGYNKPAYGYKNDGRDGKSK